jgi:hypothetical protein
MSSTLMKRGEMSTISEEVETPSAMCPQAQLSPNQAAKQAFMRAIQVFEKKVDEGGENCKIGIAKEAANKAVSQTFKGDVVTTGKNNVVGVW